MSKKYGELVITQDGNIYNMTADQIKPEWKWSGVHEIPKIGDILTVEANE